MPRELIFVTTNFTNQVANGPDLYTHNIWNFFKDDPRFDLHIVALRSDINHPRVHVVDEVPSGPGSKAYAAVEKKLLETLSRMSSGTVLHTNSAHLLSSTTIARYPSLLQINDTEVCEWKPSWKHLRSFGLRRSAALAWRRYRESKASRLAHRVICNSNATMRQIIATYGISHDRVQRIYKAADLEPFRQIAKQRRYQRGATLKLVFIGTNWRVKGLDILLRAVAKISEQEGGVALRVIGNPDCHSANEFQSLVQKLKIESHVTFVGAVSRENLPAELATSEILVLPSRKEALGLAAIEALASGMPVVASEVGGLPEVVSDLRCGTLVPPEDPELLAAAICETAANRLCQDEVNFRVESVEQFHTDRLRRELEELYLETLA